MEIKQIILSSVAPNYTRAIWAHPIDGDIVELRVFNNGEWQSTTVETDLSNYVTIPSLNEKLSEYLTTEDASNTYALKSEIPSLEEYSTSEEIAELYQTKTDETLQTTDKTIVGAINEILPKATGVGRVDPDSDGTGEIFNSYKSPRTNKATGNYSHAEGRSTTASGGFSHAEGSSTTAYGSSSHAEGNHTQAEGESSHSEGTYTIAHNTGSHAEGNSTEARGLWSHTEGISSIAYSESEHAEGSYNKSYESEDVSVRIIHSVGIGFFDTNRKNAHEIKFNGDHYIYGLGNFDGTNSANAQTLQEVINSKQATITAGTGLEFEGNTLNVTLDTTVFKVVSVLPDSPAAGDENKIHLVPAKSTGVNNAYTEYVWVNSAWEILGEYTSEVDLTPYLKTVDAQSTYATKTELTAHTGNTSNPHGVTAAQVGLGNVNNTSDADKPISTATQNALDGKQATLVSGTNIKTVNGESLLGSGNISTYNPSSIDVSILFADTASITSGISTQIAALGNSGVTEFPVLYGGASIGNIKPTWIRTSAGVTNFMCIADNKIWYFEIQGTTVQRAELAIS